MLGYFLTYNERFINHIFDSLFFYGGNGFYIFKTRNRCAKGLAKTGLYNAFESLSKEANFLGKTSKIFDFEGKVTGVPCSSKLSVLSTADLSNTFTINKWAL
ncbi:hypothetical protein TNCV_3141921 [Trichonephila clavipes]|nr:hypothetical protein TNCV_3141921 [Trichonephila clavipes]